VIGVGALLLGIAFLAVAVYGSSHRPTEDDLILVEGAPDNALEGSRKESDKKELLFSIEGTRIRHGS
jgi:hypothetical protein